MKVCDVVIALLLGMLLFGFVHLLYQSREIGRQRDIVEAQKALIETYKGAFLNRSARTALTFTNEAYNLTITPR